MLPNARSPAGKSIGSGKLGLPENPEKYCQHMSENPQG